MSEKESITLAESKEFVHCEKEIRDCVLRAGKALLTIRDKRLYRADYSTFEEYCQDKWGYTRQRGYQLIEAWETLDSLPKSCQPMVDNERVARELSKIPPRKREAVLEKIVDAGKPVTAKNIAASVPPPRRQPTVPPARKSAPVIEEKRDEIGRVIPDAILPLWERSYEMDEVFQMLARVKKILVAAEKDKDLLYVFFDFQTSLIGIEKALTECRARKPYSICPDCHGKLPEDCTTCKHSGLIGKFAWEHQTAEEKKKLILKTLKK